MSQFEEVANELSSVDQKGLSEVSKLCQKQVQLQDKIELLEQELKDTKKEFVGLIR